MSDEIAQLRTSSEGEDDEIAVPTGPFVIYGRVIGAVVAPGTSSARAASIGARILAVHALAFIGILMVAPQWWYVSIVVLAIGFVAGGRYAANCAARHRQFVNRLAEEFPEADIHEI